MQQQVKKEWIINNQNIFGLQQDIDLSISSIQYEILNQVKGKNIKSISDYLMVEIDISKEIEITKKLTIEKAFAEFLGFDNINPLGQNTFNCSLILSYLQLSLFKEYSENKHKNILTFSEYKTQYSSLRDNFLASNIDTDEQDFIKAELTLCNNLLTELNKPIYNVLSPLNEVLDNPCEYKKNLTNSIDKRKKFLEQMANEKYPKVKALFQFIEYLHSNIENFKQYNDLIKKLEKLDKKRNELKPQQNYKDKQQYDKVQAEIESKFKTLQDNTAKLIKAKAIELNICNPDKTESLWNWNIDEINKLKNDFEVKDLPEIFKYKRKYLEYRSQTHGTFLSLQFFFNDLDEIAKSLFDYFKDTEQNEFEPFETKAIEVNSITEAVQRFNKQQQTKFIVPNFMGKTQNRIREQIADFNFFQIEVIADLEFEGKIYKDIKQRNNDSILTPENWEQHKETFFTQRMETYKDSYTLAEKLKLELLSLEKLPINKTDYQILKDRYKSYLEQKKTLPPQQSEDSKPEPKETELSERIKKHFGFFNRNCPRKHKQILNDSDFEKLIEWAIWYYNNEFKVPEISEPIKVVNTNKTFVQLAFKYLFKELHKSSPYPETLFEFYQSAFIPYSEDKKSNFEAVKNNDEVKKLMQIDY